MRAFTKLGMGKLRTEHIRQAEKLYAENSGVLMEYLHDHPWWQSLYAADPELAQLLGPIPMEGYHAHDVLVVLMAVNLAEDPL